MPKDVILVLGNGINPDGSLPPKAQRRVAKGVEMFKKNLAPRIILSGAYSWHLSAPPPVSEAQGMKDFAISLGIPSQKILMEDHSRDTLANILFTKLQYLKPNDWHDLIVVTSYENIERAEVLCQKILGSDYTVKMEGIDSLRSSEELTKAIELETLKTQYVRDQFSKIQDGDDQGIREITWREFREYKDDQSLKQWLASLNQRA